VCHEAQSYFSSSLMTWTSTSKAISKFADDTKILGASRTSLTIMNELQEDINNLISWSQDWQMLFNVDKCKVMHFGRSNGNLSYYMDGSKIAKVTEEKDLGVLNRTIKCRNDNNLICFYKSLVRPYLEFCTAAWSPHYAKDRLLIEKVQRRFTWTVPRLKNVAYEDGLKELTLSSLEVCCVRADLVEVFTHGRHHHWIPFLYWTQTVGQEENKHRCETSFLFWKSYQLVEQIGQCNSLCYDSQWFQE